MRNAFAREITRLAVERRDVVLLTGDIGNRLFDEFKGLAPGRFLNCGVAEANMMSVAAGMALSGLILGYIGVAIWALWLIFAGVIAAAS